MRYPDPWYVLRDIDLETFIISMMRLGRPLEVSLVGVFDSGRVGRASRRDVDLPLHRDGVYSAALADVQGGHYVERPGIDVVGLYCMRGGPGRCVTLVGDDEIELARGEALVFDNHRVMHGRRGPVGQRLLMRMWIQRGQESEYRPTGDDVPPKWDDPPQ